jgi:hypothetical protein
LYSKENCPGDAMSKKLEFWSLIGIIGMLLLITVGCSSQESVEREVRSKPADLRVSAKQLSADFERNAIAAELKYKGKILEVYDALLIDVDAILSKRPALELSPTFVGYVGPRILCYYPKDEVHKIALLRELTWLVVKGKLQRESEGYWRGKPVLHGCIILSTNSR